MTQLTWISVEDRLPPAQELVVLLRRGRALGFGYKDAHIPDNLWTDITERDRGEGWANVFDVTHWYPIPGVVG